MTALVWFRHDLPFRVPRHFAPVGNPSPITVANHLWLRTATAIGVDA